MYDIQPCVLQPEARHRQAAGNSAERQNTASCDVTYFVAEAIFKCRNAFWAAAWQVHMLEVATLPFEPTGIPTVQVQITCLQICLSCDAYGSPRHPCQMYT